MDKPTILGRLQELTGTLRPAPETSAVDLLALQRSLAEQLSIDPEFTVSGNRLQHQAAQAEISADPSVQFSQLYDLLSGLVPAPITGPPPLVFRRETNFSSSLLGNSVPQWGAGMAPTKVFGPFLDEYGLAVWFDFYYATKLIQVYLQGSSAPVLLIPQRGTITGKKSYRIEAGSVWIASDLIARVSALSGYYTGLKVKGGSLELSRQATVSSGKIFIEPPTAATLHLDLDQKSVTGTAVEAGIDAKDAVINLPREPLSKP